MSNNNRTNVPTFDSGSARATPDGILARLTAELDSFSPQLKKAAGFILDNPNEVGVSSIREISEAADVTPNTLVRLAKSVGFEGYEELRAPFREQMRTGFVSFTDRVRWLQQVSQSGQLGPLYADLIRAAIDNIEATFSQIDAEALTRAADAIWQSRQVFTLGVGIHHANAQNFTYLASTGMVEFHAIPRPGATPTDDLTWAGPDDVLIALTSAPYRDEVVTATRLAKEQGVTIVAISDRATSPIIRLADHAFQVTDDTPQFFPSSVATIALLETLLSFVIARADEKIIERVEAFHSRRHALGIYSDD